MSVALNHNSLLDEALAQIPALSRNLSERTHDELSGKPQYFSLLSDWRRLRPRFAGDFETALSQLLQTARRGEDPLAQLQRQTPPAGISSGFGGLSLVDERQALQDVAIAHVIQMIEQQSKPELHQLTNFFAALRGTARARASDNPVRPALFAHALYRSLFGVELDAERRYALMQAAATPMAQALHRIMYERLCAQLRAAELTQLVESHAAKVQDPDADLRLRQARLGNTAPATLDNVARRVQAHNARPGALSALAGGPSPDMLSRLYDQILADPRLLPPVKALLSRLQIAIVRLSRADTTLLRHKDHPAWLLLDRVAAQGMAFERGDDPELQSFVGFMDAEVQLLIDSPMPGPSLFEQVLARVERHLERQAQQRSTASAGALAALEREQQKPQWLAVVREQIEEQIVGAPLGPHLQAFLLEVWPEVIAHSMVTEGQDAPQATAQIELVDRLLQSLHAPADEAGRTKLRDSLPGLINDLEAGCDSIKVFESQRKEALQELMRLHARLLSGQPMPPQPTPARSAPAPHEQVKQLLIERESVEPEHWAHVSVDRGHLPTVPVQLYESTFAETAVKSWFDGLTVGSWFHLFVKGEWLTAQVAWVSESHQFFLFIGQDADVRVSLTRGAIEQLLANGLITSLSENGVVQRALDTLMSELVDGAEDER
ncbi:DUF1631 family protein [Paucibacter sp. R3-3]|uniref:DUF1631 family protein n=1 Tax=Roseateles agri TaxID=3098619 RepID=A0ABU5DFB5_9BURK|nr:DUF1631 family protein [Paucibacter sp. R3-3]MDY0743969.1 DUF1631 family protein [Paucibacter sp. R3-3]